MKKNINFFAIIIVFLTFCSKLPAKDNFFLLPEQNEQALKTILKSFDQSKKTIKIAIYNFTHKKIAKKLKNVAKKGINIEIILDEHSSETKKDKSMIGYLAKYKNITMYQLKGKLSKSKKYYGKMHMKVAIIDNKTVIFGSANWSYSAFSNNYELLYITKDYAIAKKMSKYFDRLKKRAKVYK